MELTKNLEGVSLSHDVPLPNKVKLLQTVDRRKTTMPELIY